MTVVDAAPHPPARVDRADWRSWLALGLATLSAASYVVALAVPYYAAGAPDVGSSQVSPVDPPWSYPAAVGPVVGLLTFWAICAAPFACAGVAWWGLHHLWTTRTAPRGGVVVQTAIAVAVATFVWFCVQGAGILVWVID